MKKKVNIIRQQLSATMERFAHLKAMTVPPKGWLRAVRDALAMNGKQFAKRLGVSPARVIRLENDEVAGALSLNTLRKAADALGCVLVYGLIPKTSLDDTVRRQAIRKAQEKLERSSHTMALEAQELSPEGMEQALNELIEDMLRDQPRNFWDD